VPDGHAKLLGSNMKMAVTGGGHSVEPRNNTRKDGLHLAMASLSASLLAEQVHSHGGLSSADDTIGKEYG
jgi:hypothetical protein